MLTGGVIFLVGIFFWLAGDKLSWLGKLPGDIRIERENMNFYFPFTTMILLSILLSGILWLIRKFF